MAKVVNMEGLNKAIRDLESWLNEDGYNEFEKELILLNALNRLKEAKNRRKMSDSLHGQGSDFIKSILGNFGVKPE